MNQFLNNHQIPENMNIRHPTYIIAELTGEARNIVTKCREQFNPEVVGWPVDITLAGSSGVGPISTGQSLKTIIKELAPIFENIERFTFDFLSIDTFPSTGIYFLEPERENFDLLHKLLTETSICYEENRFPYNPHCTVRFGNEANSNVESYLSSLALPTQVTPDCFSIYELNGFEGKRLHKF